MKEKTLVPDEDALLTFINSTYSPTGHLSKKTDLIRDEIIDSYGIIELIEFLEETYGIQIPDERIEPDSFRNVCTNCALVRSLL